MTEFYETRAGRKFYESTMPKIAEELAKLNENIQELIEALKNADSSKSEPEAS